MIVNKELVKLLHQLVKDETAQIKLGDSNITVNVFENGTKIFLSSPVYCGDNFLPGSIREGLNKRPDLQQEHIKTYFSIEEEAYQVRLSYIGCLDHLNKRMFIDLLEEFSWLSDEWRIFLEGQDKKDLIYVRIPKK